MKQYALSLRQPWAELILQGRKDIETRTWDTGFRGEFLIHASKQVDIEACQHFGLDPHSLVIGSIVGKAKLVSSKEYKTLQQYLDDGSRHAAEFLGFSKPRYGFILAEIQRVAPMSCKGALGFFEVDA